MPESPTDRPALDAVRLAQVPGWRIEILDSTPSTNAIVADRARAGEPAGLVVTTEHQTAGRGRLDRGWEMPPRAALASSVLLRPDLPAARWPWLPLMTGVAVARALRVQGYDAAVKWPNDVLIGAAGSVGHKVCGILLERVETDLGPAAVVGIGLNTSLSAAELPVPTATSLALASAGAVDRTAVLVELLTQLARAYRELADRPAELFTAYADLSATVGAEVRAELPDGRVITGRATGVDDLGRLLIDAGGREHAVAAGDVVHARLMG
ncbi:MAG: biotin--[acetyl-CoA-carboxylase] ligase [Nocardioides sp.]|uniref:biotin--[acetyl-CoA-carboxylase] ligase n=1 Tax=Nocardioides sp. TaxID=35761 RepID=UPI0039E57880